MIDYTHKINFSAISMSAWFVFNPNDWEFLSKYSGEKIYINGCYYKIISPICISATMPNDSFELQLTLSSI